MSIRYLRKVQKVQEEEKQLTAAADADLCDTEEVRDDGYESSPYSSAPSSRNPFDLLNDDGINDQVDNSDNDTESYLENISEKELTLTTKSAVSLASTFDHRQNKKKKKKSKDDSSATSSKQEKPLDAILESLSLNPLSFSDSSGSLKEKVAKGEQFKPSILQVDSKFLKSENELRRIFGSKVVNSVEKNQAESSRQPRGGRRRVGGHAPRKCVLVTPSDHWPPLSGCLSMDFLETKHGFNYFRYVPSSSYNRAQDAFDAAKSAHDLQGISNILRQYPYHVESLITMAEYFKFMGENQKASDLITRCLYALECAWHFMFTPLRGNCQLKYNHEMNKLLFTVLFAHMINMDRQGCHRSALEVCKLLLSLDSDDPIGTLFVIDYYALRAEEYSWLEQFCDEYKNDNSLWLFPNFAYSLPICRFYLEAGPQTEEGKANSTDLMKQALLLHPPVLERLVAKVPLKDRAWAKILKHPLFESEKAGSASLDHLMNLYVEKSYLIWRLPKLQELLVHAASLAIETLNSNKSDAKDWACVRREAFPPGKNEYSHLLLSSFSDTVPTMPPDNLQDFIVDPRMGGIENGGRVGNLMGGGRVVRDLESRSLITALFESVLPWVDYGEADGGGQINNDEDEN